MAILAIFTGDGFTKQKYEELRKEVDWEHKHPTGAILHAAGFDVADVWQSEQDFNNFVNSRLKPSMERLNISMPKGEIVPIHNVNAFQDIDKYRVK
jgi:hypothetical protein